jgi:hypothetical protein
MARKKKLLDEFWEDAELPYGVHDAEKELFNELETFMNPRTYVGDGIVKSMIKLIFGLAE